MASSALRRVRGAILRLAYAPVSGAIVGSTFLLVSAGLILCEFSWESWMSDGVGLVLGGTGAALVTIAITGRRPDWTE